MAAPAVRLLLVLLLLPAASAQWQAPPDDRTLSGTEPILVKAPQGGQWMLSVDDPPGDKTNRIPLDAVCSPECTWIGFLDTRSLADGEHDLYLFNELGPQPVDVRTVQTQADLPVERDFVWPDPYNPWPLRLEGPGQVQVMVWVANLGTATRGVELTMEGPGLKAHDYWDVRANEHTGQAQWRLQPHQSRQLLVTLDVDEDASHGSRLTATSGEASWTHMFEGWTRSDHSIPVPWGWTVVALLAWLRR